MYILMLVGGLFILFDKDDTGISENVQSAPQNQSLNFKFQPTYQGANLTMSYAFD